MHNYGLFTFYFFPTTLKAVYWHKLYSCEAFVLATSIKIAIYYLPKSAYPPHLKNIYYLRLEQVALC